MTFDFTNHRIGKAIWYGSSNPFFTPANRVVRPPANDDYGTLYLLPLDIFLLPVVYWRLAKAYAAIDQSEEDDTVSQRIAKSWVAHSLYIDHGGDFVELLLKGGALEKPIWGNFMLTDNAIEMAFDKDGRWTGDFKRTGRQNNLPKQATQTRILHRLQLIEASLTVNKIAW